MRLREQLLRPPWRWVWPVLIPAKNVATLGNSSAPCPAMGDLAVLALPTMAGSSFLPVDSEV